MYNRQTYIYIYWLSNVECMLGIYLIPSRYLYTISLTIQENDTDLYFVYVIKFVVREHKMQLNKTKKHTNNFAIAKLNNFWKHN